MCKEFIHIKQLGNFKQSLLSTFGSSSYNFIFQVFPNKAKNKTYFSTPLLLAWFAVANIMILLRVHVSLHKPWVRVLPIMVMSLSGFLSFCMCYRAFTILWALASEKMCFLFLCGWRTDLALNSNKAWFPGLWVSTYCSHEILWVLKIMLWAQQDWNFGSLQLWGLQNTHYSILLFRDSLILLISGYKCLYV